MSHLDIYLPFFMYYLSLWIIHTHRYTASFSLTPSSIMTHMHAPTHPSIPYAYINPFDFYADVSTPVIVRHTSTLCVCISGMTIPSDLCLLSSIMLNSLRPYQNTDNAHSRFSQSRPAYVEFFHCSIASAICTSAFASAERLR